MISIGGNEYELRYNTRALLTIEQLAGPHLLGKKDIIAVGALLQPGTLAATSVLQLFLYAGLKWQDKNLTLDKTADLMDEYFGGEPDNGERFAELLKTISTGVNAALGVSVGFQTAPPAEEEEEVKPPDPGAGKKQRKQPSEN